jgi:uncharacterized DUF497 family protein
MYIQWNEAKRRKNLCEHCIDFAGLGNFFLGELRTHEDARFGYTERRFQSVGMLKGTLLCVTWTPIDTEALVIHLISARKANRNETQDWFTYYAQRH